MSENIKELTEILRIMSEKHFVVQRQVENLCRQVENIYRILGLKGRKPDATC